MPERTSGELHFRGLAPGRHSSEETPQWWRAVGDTRSDLGKPRPRAPIAIPFNECDKFVSELILTERLKPGSLFGMLVFVCCCSLFVVCYFFVVVVCCLKQDRCCLVGCNQDRCKETLQMSSCPVAPMLFSLLLLIEIKFNCWSIERLRKLRMQ